MVSTTFVDSPGITILHSQDLVNWEIASHVAAVVDGGDAYSLQGGDAYRGGFWACSLRYHAGTFYLLVNPTFGNARLYYSNDVAGTWQYHQLDRPAYDPGLFFDDDGSGYIVTGHDRMDLMELSSDYSSVVSQTSGVFDAGGEGAHVIKRGEFYYVFNANPRSWPFQLLCSRAKNLRGPWETGKVVLTETAGGHQGSVVELADGTWFGFVHQDNGAVGRMPKIGPVFWENDWPVFGTPGNRDQIADTGVKPILGKAIKQPAASDDFGSSTLGLQWQWNHNPDATKWSLSERSGFLRLKPSLANGFWTAKNTLTQKGQGPQSHGVAKFDLSNLKAGDRAGLGSLGKVNGSIFVVVDAEGNKWIRTAMDNRGVGKHEGGQAVPFAGNSVFLRMDMDFEKDLGVCSYSSDGANWTTLGGNFPLAFDIEFSTFQGEKYAIFCYNTETDSSSGYVDVDSFEFGDTSERVVVQRGRPRLNEAGTTFVADNGQLLRGHFTSTEWSEPPPRENLAKIKALGSNAIHLYGEVFDANYPANGSQAPGYSAARIDDVVKNTRELGLYLVLTIGNGANNGKFNRDYVVDFWNFYAERYKDETHVVFEIQNEPVAWSPPYSQAALDMEVAAYNAIRSHAPDSPILLFSYSVLGQGEAAIQDLNKIGGLIDWSNAGVAFHGYAGFKDTVASIDVILNAGYPVFMTEFTNSDWGYSRDFLDLELTAALEERDVSWLSFLHVPPNFINEPVTEPETFLDVVDKAGLSWVPDFGSWPVARGVFGNDGIPPATTDTWVAEKLTGTLRIEAESFDLGGQNVAYYDKDSSNRGGAFRTDESVDILATSDSGGGYALAWVEGGEWLEYTFFVKEAGYYDLGLRYAASGGSGSVRAFFNGVDRTGAWGLSGTGGVQNWDTAKSQVFLEYGRQKLRLEVESGGFNLNWMELSPAATGPIEDGTYRFVNRKSGLAMQGDVANGSIVQSPYEGSSQEWIVRHVGAGQYQVRFAKQTRYWSVFYQNNGEPLDLVGWWNVDSSSQRFLLTPTGDGYYYFRPVDGGLCLEVEEASTDSGAQVLQHRFEGGSHQLWAILGANDISFPIGLEVTVEGDAYRLSWTAASGANSYNIKRSDQEGGPYTLVASGVSGTTYLDADVQEGEIWHYVVSAQVGSKESLESSEVEANPPRIWASFSFDEGEGTSAVDGTGNGWEASVVGATGWSDGHEGGAIDLGGVDGHVLLSEGIVSELSDFTIATWVYLDARPTWCRIFDFGAGTNRYMFMSPNGGSGTFRYAITSGSGEQLINGGQPLPVGEWLHVAVTLEGSTGILYLNGEEVGRNDAMTIAPKDLGITNQNYIGKSQWTGDVYLDGRVDEFQIYNNALSAEGILALYQAQPRPPIAESELKAPSMEVIDSVAYIRIEETVSGRGYLLERTENPAAGSWEAFGAWKTGTGEPIEFVVPLDPDVDLELMRIRIRK